MAVNTHSLSLSSGSSQSASAGDTIPLQFSTGNFTIMAWVRRSSTGGNQSIVSKNNNNTEGFRLFFNNENKIRMDLIEASSTDMVVSNTAISSTSDFNHIAVTRSGSTVTIYLNGVSDVTGSSSKNVSAVGSTVMVGNAVIDGVNNFFNGFIDEVRLYKGTALTAAQILSISRKKSLIPSGLSAYWKLNNSYTDSTTNNNTLTPVNSPTFSTTVPFRTYRGSNGLIGLIL